MVLQLRDPLILFLDPASSAGEISEAYGHATKSLVMPTVGMCPPLCQTIWLRFINDCLFILILVSQLVIKNLMRNSDINSIFCYN